MDAYTLFAILAICCTVMIVGASWASAWRDRGTPMPPETGSFERVNPNKWTYTSTSRPVTPEKKKTTKEENTDAR